MYLIKFDGVFVCPCFFKIVLLQLFVHVCFTGIDVDKARKEEERIMLQDALAVQDGGGTLTPHPNTKATALHVAAAKGYIEVLKWASVYACRSDNSLLAFVFFLMDIPLIFSLSCVFPSPLPALVQSAVAVWRRCGQPGYWRLDSPACRSPLGAGGGVQSACWPHVRYECRQQCGECETNAININTCH